MSSKAVILTFANDTPNYSRNSFRQLKKNFCVFFFFMALANSHKASLVILRSRKIVVIAIPGSVSSRPLAKSKLEELGRNDSEGTVRWPYSAK
jgi:hypothetical protein